MTETNLTVLRCRRVYLAFCLFIVLLAVLRMNPVCIDSVVSNLLTTSFRDDSPEKFTYMNIARGKTVLQSSTFQNFDAQRAIDGDITTSSQTDVDDPYPWIEVDLQNTYPVDSVIFINRWCEDSSGLHGAVLSLVNGDGDVVANRTIDCNNDFEEFDDGWKLGNHVSLLYLLMHFDEFFCVFTSHRKILYVVLFNTKKPTSFSISHLPRAQKVKIQSTTSGEQLKIYELQVWSPRDVEPNIIESDNELENAEGQVLTPSTGPTFVITTSQNVTSVEPSIIPTTNSPTSIETAPNSSSVGEDDDLL